MWSLSVDEKVRVLRASRFASRSRFRSVMFISPIYGQAGRAKLAPSDQPSSPLRSTNMLHRRVHRQLPRSIFLLLRSSPPNLLQRANCAYSLTSTGARTQKNAQLIGLFVVSQWCYCPTVRSKFKLGFGLVLATVVARRTALEVARSSHRSAHSSRTELRF